MKPIDSRSIAKTTQTSEILQNSLEWTKYQIIMAILTIAGNSKIEGIKEIKEQINVEVLNRKLINYMDISMCEIEKQMK